MPSEQEIVSVVEGALLAKRGSLSAPQALADLGWDSMAMVAFAGEIADRYQIALSVDQVAACQTVGELVSVVRAQGR